MRFLALAAAAALLLLSGCVQEEDEGTEDPLMGLCPAWEPGPDELPLSFDVAAGNATVIVVAPPDGALEFEGRPLDRVRVRIDAADVQGGRLEMRATRNDTGAERPVLDHRNPESPQGPFASLQPGADVEGALFDVLLSPLDAQEPRGATPVVLHWSMDQGQAHVEATVTFHYWVCGAVAG